MFSVVMPGMCFDRPDLLEFLMVKLDSSKGEAGAHVELAGVYAEVTGVHADLFVHSCRTACGDKGVSSQLLESAIHGAYPSHLPSHPFSVALREHL